MSTLYLSHHGILGQKWGDRNGPPYPLQGGDYSQSEKQKIYKARRSGHNIYNKKHFDTVLKKDNTTLRTLSYDKDRTKNVDMFYAAHTRLDKHQYNAMFNKKISSIDGSQCYKWKIDNSIKTDMKVASEDSGAKAFMRLYKNDRNFYNFVKDPQRLQSLYPSDKYKFKGYRESDKVIKKLQNGDYTPTEKDLKVVYRLFNYSIPSDGSGNQRVANDVKTQREKFFSELKKDGYGAVLDVNDAIYGGFKASSPVIVFDVEQIIPKEVRETKTSDKIVSTLATVGRKVTGL